MKKLISAVILLAMISSLFSFGAFSASADEAFLEWSGNTDTSWFNSDAPAPDYIIDTPEKLAGLAEIVNAQEIKEPGYGLGITFHITVNMDLKGIEWIPIGNKNAAAFAGTLEGRLGGIEGQMVTIKGLSIKEPAINNIGLVGTQGAGGIKNIRLQDAVIDTDMNTAGSFVGYSKYSDCVYENLISDAQISTVAGKYAGGIVAYASNPSITFKNCVYTGDITVFGDTENVGGLCGHITQFATIENVYVSSDIVNYSGNAKRTGGIVGNLGSNNVAYTATFTDVQFDGTVKSSATQAGSFIGRLNAAPEGAQVTLENCLNTGLSAQNYSPATMAMSWIGLAANYNLTMKISFKNCYTMSDVQLLSRADYKDGETPSVFNVIVNGAEQLVTVASNTSLSGFKTTLVTFDALKGDGAKTALTGCDFTERWSVRDGKTPVLALALPYADDTHSAADISWFSSEKTEGYTVTTEAQLRGLAEILKVNFFEPDQILIDPSLHETAKTVLTEDWYNLLVGADDETTAEDTTDPSDETSAEITENTEESSSEESSADAPSENTTGDQASEKGCGSLIAGGTILISLLAAVLVIKKKD